MTAAGIAVARAAKAEKARLAALPITDNFQELIDRYAEETDGVPPLATVDLHAGDGNGLGLKIKRWTFEEFDEERVLSLLIPGRNALVLRFAGVRDIIAQRILVGPDRPDAVVPEPMPELEPELPTTMITPADSVGMMMQMMQMMSVQAQAQASQQQETNNLLLMKLLDASNQRREKTALEELVQLDEMLDRRAKSRDSESGELAGAVAPLLSALADGMKEGKAAVPPVAQPTAAPKQITAKPRPATLTKDQKWEAMILRIADMLAAGARRPDTDPEAYAVVVLDYIETAGFNPKADIFDKVPENGLTSALCAKYPQLPAAFVASVERAMRSIVNDEADESANTPEGKESDDEQQDDKVE